MLLRFDRARSGCPVDSKTVSGRAGSGLSGVDLLGSRVFPDHVAHSSMYGLIWYLHDSVSTLKHDIFLKLVVFQDFLCHYMSIIKHQRTPKKS